jgi:hypothetical protein
MHIRIFKDDHRLDRPSHSGHHFSRVPFESPLRDPLSGPVATELAAAEGHKLAVSFTTGTKVNKPVAAASPNLMKCGYAPDFVPGSLNAGMGAA